MIRLRGELVELREVSEDDTESVYRLLGDDTVTEWLSFDSRSVDECRVMLAGIRSRAAVDPREEYYLGIAVCEDLIGFVRLGRNGVSAAKLGYAVRSDQWGHGYATDAVRTMMQFGFDQLGLHRVSAAVGPSNAASISVLRKVGMTKEGCIRDHVFTNGAWRDSQLFSMLAHEWSAVALDASA